MKQSINPVRKANRRHLFKQAGRIYGKGMGMLNSILHEENETLSAMWLAEDLSAGGVQHKLENSPELYGQSLASLQGKYCGHVYAAHEAQGTDASPDMEERDAALVASTGHIGDVEKPL